MKILQIFSIPIGVISSPIEEYIFPLFEHHKKSLKLVHTLREQHNKGRQITKVVLELSQSTDPKNTKKIQSLLKKFIKMYRPHEAREDTVLFPQVRSLLSTQQFDELGEKFEELEHKLFGKHGFESVVKKVEAIEKELDIYRLEKFTPR
jgi:hemerythrin-like domain-containing protein